MIEKLKAFYDREYREGRYAYVEKPEEHGFYPILKNFIEQYQLQQKKCLEVGCGRGIFQNVVDNYVGVDISESVRELIYKPFYRCCATNLPFEDNSFDAIWTNAVLEHVPEPEKAMQQMRRVLKNGGLLLFNPAWQCRSWAAQGYAVRAYSDFNWKGKIIKASIPVRNSILFRCTYIFPKRIISTIQYLVQRKGKPVPFVYKKITANYDYCWTSDSDAVNSLYPYRAILWFVSRGDKCLSHASWLSKFFVRGGPLIFQIQKS
jgi:SAM-dependent methyltransferase